MMVKLFDGLIEAENAMSYAFPLRENFTVHLRLPRDLSDAEAERIAAFIKSLVMPGAGPAAVTDHFEARHRALREEAEGTRKPGRWARLGDFQRATAPLVDDLVAAVREHDHEAAMGACAICDALAALDEASR